MLTAARKVLHAIGPLHRALSRHRGTLIHWPTYRPRSLEHLGSDYGGWTVVPDLLKMDIEGFEYGVIDDVLAGPLRPAQWAIEFHHRMMHFDPDQTRRAVGQLEAAGYRLFAVSNVGHEYSFVHESAG